MTRADDSPGGPMTLNRALLVSAAVGLLGLAGLTGTAAASGRHRTHRRHGARASTQTVLTSYKGPWGLQLVVTQKGQKLALFDFSKDGPGKSACYGKCQKVWYPLLDHGKIVIRGNGIRRKQLKTFKRKDGSLQIEYYGQPLYRCHADTKTGQKNGANSYQFGGSWGLMGIQGSPLQAGQYGGGKPPPGC